MQRELLISLQGFYKPAGSTASALERRFCITPATLRIQLRALKAAGLGLSGSATEGYRSSLGESRDSVKWVRWLAGRRPLQLVRVKLTGDANRRNQTDKLCFRPEWYSEIALNDDTSVVTFITRDLSFLLRWLRAAPAGVSILEPQHIRQAVQQVRFR